MTELLDGFVPGLPEELRTQILARAEGVPLYAVETVRMLLDRGLLVQEGAVYRPTGEIPSLDVPETLHGLVASRLDGLPAEERRLLQDAAVLGKTFTRQGLAAVGGLTEAELDPLLSSLARKEILGVQADPTSPEHGQYGFLQDLVRHVAYETLSKKERRARHLAAAAYLEGSFANEDEIAEVLASHYLDAYTALPDADDAAEVKAKASEALVRAGDRAAVARSSRRGTALLRAGGRAHRRCVGAGRAPRSRGLARRLHGRVASCRATARRGDRACTRPRGISALPPAFPAGSPYIEAGQGRMEDAVARAEAAFRALEKDEPGQELAVTGRPSRAGLLLHRRARRALQKADLAIELSESLGSPEALARAFSSMALVRRRNGPEQSTALLKQSLAIAREHDLYDAEYNALFNLSDLSFRRDRYEDALTYLADALALARRRGSRTGEWESFSETTYPLFMLGRWDEALEAFSEVPEERYLDALTISFLSGVLELQVHRGQVAEAARVLSLYEPLRDSADVQNRSCFVAAEASVARADERLEEALRLGVEAADISRSTGADASQPIKQGLVVAVEAALALGEHAKAEELVGTIEAVPPGLRSPYLGAQALRFRARLATADDAPALFDAAAMRFREQKNPFWLAVTLLEHSELTGDTALLDEAGEIFEQLEARPWLERLAAARSHEKVTA